MHYEEHFCELIFELNHWFRRYRFKILLVYISGDHLVRRSETVWIILANGIMAQHLVPVE